MEQEEGNEIQGLILVYPKLNSKEMIVKIGFKLLGTRYNILNELGRRVKHGKLSQLVSHLSLKKLPQGIYELQISKGNTSYKFKI